MRTLFCFIPCIPVASTTRNFRNNYTHTLSIIVPNINTYRYSKSVSRSGLQTVKLCIAWRKYDNESPLKDSWKKFREILLSWYASISDSPRVTQCSILVVFSKIMSVLTHMLLDYYMRSSVPPIYSDPRTYDGGIIFAKK